MHAPAPAVQRRGASAAMALLLAALLAVPLPGAAQGAGTIEVDAGTSGTAQVDLRADAGKDIVFRLDEADRTKAKQALSMLVELSRASSSDRISLAAQRGSDGIWAVSLPVDTVDLVAGDWAVRYYVNATRVLAGSRDLHVTLSDTEAPGIEMRPAGDPVRLGLGDSLEIVIEEEFLRAVTATHAGLPHALTLSAPYRLSSEALPEGVTEVTVTATDRANQVSTAVARVDRDTLAPRLAVSVPEVGYVGVPFAIIANATERSQNTVRLVHNGSAESRTVGGSAADFTASHVFVVTVPEVGNVSYTVEAVDVVGNRATSIFTVPVVAPPTDLRAISVGPAPGPVTFVGNPAIVVASLEQVGGVTSLPVTVTFSTAGQEETMTVTLPAAGALNVEWNVTLPPGPREVGVRVAAPAFANETNPGNENATATIETFLGSVRVGDDLFLIRADARGLPKAAVEEGTAKSYPLTLNQSSSDGVRYEFTLPGDRLVTWDPLDPIAPEPEATESSSSSSTGDDKGAPGPGLLMALLVLALAALAQRRQR